LCYATLQSNIIPPPLPPRHLRPTESTEARSSAFFNLCKFEIDQCSIHSKASAVRLFLIMVLIVAQFANVELYAQQLAGRRYVDRVFTQYRVDSVFHSAHASLRDNQIPNANVGSYIDWYNDVSIYTYTPLGNTISRNSTVFLLPGDGFIKLTEAPKNKI
jgi:hypothetical protein